MLMIALRLMRNKRLRCLKGECDRLKNYENKINSPFMIYVDFESILLQEDNGKQNPDEFYTKKY